MELLGDLESVDMEGRGAGEGSEPGTDGQLDLGNQRNGPAHRIVSETARPNLQSSAKEKEADIPICERELRAKAPHCLTLLNVWAEGASKKWTKPQRWVRLKAVLSGLEEFTPEQIEGVLVEAEAKAWKGITLEYIRNSVRQSTSQHQAGFRSGRQGWGRRSRHPGSPTAKRGDSWDKIGIDPKA